MAISSSEFQHLHQLVASRSGIVLSEREKFVVEARLVPLVRQQQATSVSDLVAKARNGDQNGLPDLIVDALLPKDTMFFRDPPLFDYLRNQLFRAVEMKRSHECRLRIWCAGCSGGQEAYSIAMLLHRYCSQLLKWDLEILATDLSQSALEKAQLGRFDEVEVHRGVQPILVREYFRQEGSHFIAKDEISQLIRVEPLNLIGDWPALPEMDIVLLRNVLRYMTSETKRLILARLKRLLKPDGYLFLGAQESVAEREAGYTMVPAEKTVYFQPARSQDRF